jgi:tetratricopeptide (TPR) repeat protein
MRNAYLESKQEFDRAEEIASSNGLHNVSLDNLLRRAMILFFAEQLAASQEAYRRALQLALVQGDLFSQALALAGTGKNLMIRKDYRGAIGWYEQALSAAMETGASLLAAAMHSELGWCYYNLNEDEKALDLFRLSETAFLNSGAMTNYQISLGNIGNIFVRRGDYPTAISYFQRALELARKNEDRISMVKWLNNLSDAFFRLGNPVPAGEYRRQLTILQAELQRERERARSAVKKTD